tara:strand:- start:799 stop:2022 length:1224 start_codon:yes stop_codon:yes gene_type:complete
METTKTKVLIAEDLRSSRLVIVRLLAKWGFEPIPCKDGLAAQEALAQPDGPRIAILDWMMPNRSGPEVCEWIADELGAFVYTILLTSKSEQADLFRGLTAGAHAYITKPTDPPELEAWLKVGLRVVGYETELACKNEELQRYATQMELLAEERAKQLVHADRMVTLGTMIAGIAHEINNSTTLLSGNVQTLEKFWPVVETSLREVAKSDQEDSRLGFILKEAPNILNGMRSGVVRISKIVKGLRTYAHHEGSDDLEPTQINDCIHAALELCDSALRRTATATLNLATDLPQVLATPHQIEQVFVNMVVNACDAIRPTAPGVISITTSSENDNILINFEDTGSGIPAEIIGKIWDPFFTTKGIGKGTGLGLSISLGIIESHGGTYRVENRNGGGARFIMTLPINKNVF